jgi:acyl dehydratase
VSAGASREPSVAEPAIIRGVDCLYERRGTDLVVGEWVQVERGKIAAFAKLAGDEHWILTRGLSTGLLNRSSV